MSKEWQCSFCGAWVPDWSMRHHHAGGVNAAYVGQGADLRAGIGEMGVTTQRMTDDPVREKPE